MYSLGQVYIVLRVPHYALLTDASGIAIDSLVRFLRSPRTTPGRLHRSTSALRSARFRGILGNPFLPLSAGASRRVEVPSSREYPRLRLDPVAPFDARERGCAGRKERRSRAKERRHRERKAVKKDHGVIYWQRRGARGFGIGACIYQLVSVGLITPGNQKVFPPTYFCIRCPHASAGR